MSISQRLKTAWNHPKVTPARDEFRRYTNDIRGSLNRSLFDASPEFFTYHIGGLAFVLAADLVLNSLFTPAYMWEMQTLTGVIWAGVFFVVGFILRSHYLRANWHSQSQVMVIVKSVASAIFFGFFVVFVVWLFAMVFYFDELYRYYSDRTPDVSSIQVAGEFFFRNWFGTSFYLLVWIMLYMGITSRRAAKQIEFDNLRLQNSLKEAELSSLSNQLNPHFLFNALNNIRFMIHEDANTAEKMLMSLSSVLRYSLESSKKINVALEAELDISQRYIDLIQIQFEERLRFELDIPKPLLHCQLPPMVLQMLLENAVKHGIEDIKEGGTINVKARMQGKRLVIEVINDLPQDLQAGKLKRSPNVKQKEPGIGLFNIGQRLDLLYGEEASLETKESDGRFYVTLAIPQS